MNIVYILIGLATGFVLGWAMRGEGKMEKFNAEAGDKKEIAKEKILRFMRDKDVIGNNEVQKLLGVSDATATNYLSELEAEGKITQLGDTGRSVTYKLNG